jgi:acyl-CoA thioesterase
VTAPSDPGVGPFADLLGIRRASMADGRCRFELPASALHLNPHGAVHGGVVYTLVDYAMGGAVTSGL